MQNRPPKRKAERKQSPRYTQPDPALYIQAHEAEIIRGPHAHACAVSLEALQAESETVKTRLLKWNPSGDGNESSEARWVDRYDVRLLIDTLPSSTEGETLQSNDARLSPTGWSDLPSDTEDTFFFSPEEVEDYHREKRRRMIDQSREERLRALRGEAGDDEDENFDDDPWGGSDEEPDEAQKDFMRRTATHILNSPNPAQLEMRILANHGADKRFAFLRGRWSRTWKITMGRTRIQLEAKKNKNTEERKAGLGGLAGYGDSDASEDERVDDADENKETGKVLDLQETDDAKMQLPNPQFPSEEALKEARRAKAREWAAKRRASNQSGAQ